MIFISLGRLKEETSEETPSGVNKLLEDFKKHDIKVLGFHWAPSRYDTVLIFEAPNEKAAMEISMKAADVVTTETMVAVPREEPTQ